MLSNIVLASILLRLANCPDLSKDMTLNLSKGAKPLDNQKGHPYIGEIRFNIEDYNCYKYTETGWEEIK